MMTAGFVVCFQFNQLSCFLGVAQRDVPYEKSARCFYEKSMKYQFLYPSFSTSDK